MIEEEKEMYYYYMSGPEVLVLLFVIFLWLLSIFCCIKRYEKISTIERADLPPQYRKEAFGMQPRGSQLSNSSSSNKNLNSLVRHHSSQLNPHHYVPSPSGLFNTTAAVVTPHQQQATNSTTNMYSSSASNERLSFFDLSQSNNNGSVKRIQQGRNSNKLSFREDSKLAEILGQQQSRHGSQHSRHRKYYENNRAMNMSTLSRNLNDTGDSTSNFSYTYYKKLSPLDIYNHPAFASHQPSPQLSYSRKYYSDRSNENSLSILNEFGSNNKRSVKSVHSHSIHNNNDNDDDDDVMMNENDGAHMTKSNSEPTFLDLVEESHHNQGTSDDDEEHHHRDKKVRVCYVNDNAATAEGEEDMIAFRGSRLIEFRKESKVYQVSTRPSNQFLQLNHQMQSFNQDESSSRPDRLDPSRIPKVIKKSLIDLHKRSVWNLAHQQQHLQHLEQIHNQQQQQQLQKQRHPKLYNLFNLNNQKKCANMSSQSSQNSGGGTNSSSNLNSSKAPVATTSTLMTTNGLQINMSNVVTQPTKSKIKMRVDQNYDDV